MMYRLSPAALRQAHVVRPSLAHVDSARGAAPNDDAPAYRADAAQLTKLMVAELARTPARIVALVTQALPRFVHAEVVTLTAHPADLALLPGGPELTATYALSGTLSMHSDASLTRGGCTFDSSLGALDARVETTVALLLAAAEAHA